MSSKLDIINKLNDGERNWIRWLCEYGRPELTMRKDRMVIMNMRGSLSGLKEKKLITITKVPASMKFKVAPVGSGPVERPIQRLSLKPTPLGRECAKILCEIREL